jgi:DNA invertase Pin-like site-specific DNA recombinase
MGWTIQALFVDDGVSGAARSRPALDELRCSIARGQTDVAVVAKLDRLGRTVRGLVEWMSEWDDQGVALVSVSESFDSSSPAARMQRNLLAMFAEFERDRMSERTSEGRAATVAIGGWPGGPAPFGWRLVRTPLDRFTRLELDETEAATIRRAVDLFVHERKGSTQTFRMLNAEGRPSRGGPGRTLRTTWSATKVKNLLAWSDYFAGTWTYRSRSIGHPKNVGGPPVAMQIPPLLSEAEVAALRVRLAETSTPKFGHGDRGPYLLSRRITSPHGTPMYGSWRKQRATAMPTSTSPTSKYQARSPHCRPRRHPSGAGHRSASRPR